MTEQVSVRLAVVGGQAFRAEMASAAAVGTSAMQRLQTAVAGVSPAFRSVAIQATTMLSTMAGGSPAAAALAGGLGRAAAAATAFGVVGGVVVAALTALVPLLLQGRKSAADMAEEMVRLEGSASSVQGALSALAQVQREYLAATQAQGGAASAAAAAVVSASAREFAARKEVLAVEIELLRIRGQERASDLQNLETVFGRERDAAFDNDLRRRGVTADTARENRDRQPGQDRYPTDYVDAFLDRNRQTILAIRKLRAEAELEKLALERAEALMNSDFSTVSGGSAAGGAAVAGAKGGGGGGGGAVNELLKEGQRVFDQTRTAAERYAAEVQRLNDLLKAGAIDQDTYNRAVAQLKGEYESASAFASSVAGEIKSAFSSLFDAIVEGGGKAGEVIASLGRRLAAMTLQEATFRLLSRLLPGTFGAGGFIPLVGSAMGNAFDGGRVVAFARGGIVSAPTMFPMRGGAGLMGEAGPEAIMPLTRVGGRLGVAATGAGAQTVVQVVNMTGAPAREERTRGPDGREMVRIVVGEQLARGEHDAALRSRFGSAPQRVRR